MQNPQGKPVKPESKSPFKMRGSGGRIVPLTATSKKMPCHMKSGDGGRNPRGQTKRIG